MNILRALLGRLRPEPPMAKIDLASFNPLGKATVGERARKEELNAESIKEEITELITQIEQAYHRHREKYLHTEITDDDAKTILAALPTVDFGEYKISLSLRNEAFLTEEKHTLIKPLLEKLGQLRNYGEEAKVSMAEYIELKGMLLRGLMKLFSSPLQIPTFDWTITQLKELEMIPNNFGFREMERYCALGRWG